MGAEDGTNSKANESVFAVRKPLLQEKSVQKKSASAGMEGRPAAPSEQIFKARPAPELQYSPFTPDPEEILLPASSDDDSPSRRLKRKRRREQLGQDYLTNHSLYIASAALRGPFEGWKNPYAKRITMNRDKRSRQAGLSTAPIGMTSEAADDRIVKSRRHSTRAGYSAIRSPATAWPAPNARNYLTISSDEDSVATPSRLPRGENRIGRRVRPTEEAKRPKIGNGSMLAMGQHAAMPLEQQAASRSMNGRRGSFFGDFLEHHAAEATTRVRRNANLRDLRIQEERVKTQVEMQKTKLVGMDLAEDGNESMLSELSRLISELRHIRARMRNLERTAAANTGASGSPKRAREETRGDGLLSDDPSPSKRPRIPNRSPKPKDTTALVAAPEDVEEPESIEASSAALTGISLPRPALKSSLSACSLNSQRQDSSEKTRKKNERKSLKKLKRRRKQEERRASKRGILASNSRLDLETEVNLRDNINAIESVRLLFGESSRSPLMSVPVERTNVAVQAISHEQPVGANPEGDPPTPAPEIAPKPGLDAQDSAVMPFQPSSTEEHSSAQASNKLGRTAMNGSDAVGATSKPLNAAIIDLDASENESQPRIESYSRAPLIMNNDGDVDFDIQAKVTVRTPGPILDKVQEQRRELEQEFRKEMKILNSPSGSTSPSRIEKPISHKGNLLEVRAISVIRDNSEESLNTLWHKDHETLLALPVSKSGKSSAVSRTLDVVGTRAASVPVPGGRNAKAARPTPVQPSPQGKAIDSVETPGPSRRSTRAASGKTPTKSSVAHPASKDHFEAANKLFSSVYESFAATPPPRSHVLAGKAFPRRSPYVLPASTTLPSFQYNRPTKLKLSSTRPSLENEDQRKAKKTPRRETNIDSIKARKQAAKTTKRPSLAEGSTNHLVSSNGNANDAEGRRIPPSKACHKCSGDRPSTSCFCGIEIRPPPTNSMAHEGKSDAVRRVSWAGEASDSSIAMGTTSSKPRRETQISKTSEAFPDAQPADHAPAGRPSGPSTELLETDKHSVNVPSTAELDNFSTQAEFARAQRSLQDDLFSPTKAEHGKDASDRPPSGQDSRTPKPKDVRSRGWFGNAAYAKDWAGELPSTQAIADGMSPFNVSTEKRKGRPFLDIVRPAATLLGRIFGAPQSTEGTIRGVSDAGNFDADGPPDDADSPYEVSQKRRPSPDSSDYGTISDAEDIDGMARREETHATAVDVGESEADSLVAKPSSQPRRQKSTRVESRGAVSGPADEDVSEPDSLISKLPSVSQRANGQQDMVSASPSKQLSASAYDGNQSGLGFLTPRPPPASQDREGHAGSGKRSSPRNGSGKSSAGDAEPDPKGTAFRAKTPQQAGLTTSRRTVQSETTASQQDGQRVYVPDMSGTQLDSAIDEATSFLGDWSVEKEAERMRRG